jgi:Uma2 family endonuclease
MQEFRKDICHRLHRKTQIFIHFSVKICGICGYKTLAKLIQRTTSEQRNLIVTNVVSELRAQLKKRPCKVYPSDMRVRINPKGPYTYPDVIVICGIPRFEDEHRDILLNPTLIVKVLSESTEAYDRGRKFEHYRKIESLKEYVLIAQDKYNVEQFVKQDNDKWLFSEVKGLEGILKLTSINCELLIPEIYDKVEFNLL